MRKLIFAVILFFVLIFTLPIFLLKPNKIAINSGDDYEKYITAGSSSFTIKVYDAQLRRAIDLDLEEYVLGVLAGEMPASFHLEALKAQCVAARTYTVKRLKALGGKGCLNHPEADVCTESTHCQAYRDPKLLSTENLQKLSYAIENTKGEVIVYQDSLIDAVFHSTSGGRTENSEDVWQAKLPYLRGVVSDFERHSPKLTSTIQIKISEFASNIKKLDSSLKLDTKKLSGEMKILERSSGGRIISMKIGNKTFKGERVRTALGLNSANFSYAIKGDSIVFNVSGNGHGIGLSQYGADGMAQQGHQYKDILTHYYSDVEIINVYDFYGDSNK